MIPDTGTPAAVLTSHTVRHVVVNRAGDAFAYVEETARDPGTWDPVQGASGAGVVTSDPVALEYPKRSTGGTQIAAAVRNESEPARVWR